MAFLVADQVGPARAGAVCRRTDTAAGLAHLAVGTQGSAAPGGRRAAKAVGSRVNLLLPLACLAPECMADRQGRVCDASCHACKQPYLAGACSPGWSCGSFCPGPWVLLLAVCLAVFFADGVTLFSPTFLLRPD
ncbi:hypothetical protein LHGZ1_2301 [Laribacter hongkongensis]|uniref:Uncharacterized protein n=1 Tax=Laribacter hongkongensis TaxID=168471 RepID=A0A248LKF4_9NEIS|nr:hypothetical protein LHGZ1_2301 [Laribacter hongkongensis]